MYLSRWKRNTIIDQILLSIFYMISLWDRNSVYLFRFHYQWDWITITYHYILDLLSTLYRNIDPWLLRFSIHLCWTYKSWFHFFPLYMVCDFLLILINSVVKGDHQIVLLYLSYTASQRVVVQDTKISWFILVTYYIPKSGCPRYKEYLVSRSILRWCVVFS